MRDAGWLRMCWHYANVCNRRIFRAVFNAALLWMITSGVASAADAAASPSPTDTQTDQSRSPSDTVLSKTAARIDRLHGQSEQLVQSLVGRVDAFFVNDEFATFTDNESRVRLRLDADHWENAGWDVAPRVRLQLVMPGLQRRLRLVVNDGDVEESGQPVDDDSKDNDIAFRWVNDDDDRIKLSYDLGLRISGSGVDPFVRFNAGISYPVAEQWQGQTTNRLFHYVKRGWRNDFAQTFDRPLADDLLLRSRSRIQYFQNRRHNPTLEQKFSLFHTLDEQSVLAFEALWRQRSEEDSVYGDEALLVEPRNHYDQFAIQARYRRNIGRPWFFVELWPILYWPEERDYEASLAARIRVEVNLGDNGKLALDD